MPIPNHFFTLKVEILNLQADGWLREKYKELVIASYEIKISDLNKPPFSGDGSISLPIPKFDAKKLGLIPNGQSVEGNGRLHMSIEDMTRIDALIVYNPNRDISEDRPYTQDYSIKDFNTVLTRTKLMINFIETCLQSDAFIFQFYYPRFSYCCWASLQIFIYLFDLRYLLTYTVVGLLWLLLAYSPVWKINVTPKIRKFFFRSKLMHPLLKRGAGIDVLKSDDINFVKSLNSLIDNNDGEDVIA